jgi:putative flippase GtrA
LVPLKSFGRIELVRFGLVATVGLAVDLSLAWALAVLLNQPLPLASVAGFAAGATVNYVLHELWTFQDGARELSRARAGRYLIALGLTLIVRLISVVLLYALLPVPDLRIVVLVMAAGISFLVNYAASKLMVFRFRHWNDRSGSPRR